MKLKTIVIIFLTIFFLNGCIFSEKDSNTFLEREEINFNKDWQFAIDETQLKWSDVVIPHSAKIEPLIVNDQWQGTAWYKKEFDFKSLNEQKIFLRFEGVMHETDIWLNDQHLIKHLGGYCHFQWILPIT